MRTHPTARPRRRRGFALSSLPVVTAVLAFGCQGQKGAPPQMPPPGVTVTHPVLHPVQGYYDYNGYLDSVEMVQIKARVKGYLEKVFFTEGTEIAKDADLYTIDPREFEAGVAKAQAEIERAKADNANARAQIKLAQAELKRQNDLGNAAAQTDKDKAAATLSAYEASLLTAVANEQAGNAALRTAKLELEYTKIKAPIAGLISRTLVTQGNLVGQNETTLLTTIMRMDELYVYYDAPERDLVDYLRATGPTTGGDAGSTKIEIGLANDAGFAYRGEIDFRENKVDTGTGTVRVRGRIKNPVPPGSKSRMLYPGLYAKVRVPSGPERKLPVIPEDALMTGQEGRYVYVVDDKGVATKRAVTVVPQVVWKVQPPTGTPAPGWMLDPGPQLAAKGPDGTDTKPMPPASPKAVQSIVAIESGLAVGDRVVVNGLQKVFPGKPVTPEKWELQAPAKK